MSGRGRGARQSDVNMGKNSFIKDNRESSLYQDGAVYMDESRISAIRRQGRHKRSFFVQQTYPRPNEVIFVSAARGRQFVVPVRNSVLQRSVGQSYSGVSESRQLSVSPRCLDPRLTATGLRAVNVVTRPPGRQASSPETEIIIWPEDLKELVDNLDNFPERKLRDTVKWFQTPLSSSQPPQIVNEIQAMWASMPETWQEKVDMALEWLTEVQAPPTPPARENIAAGNNLKHKRNDAAADYSMNAQLSRVAFLSENKAKVLVEVQPNHIQDCGQWSSMAENRED